MERICNDKVSFSFRDEKLYNKYKDLLLKTGEKALKELPVLYDILFLEWGNKIQMCGTLKSSRGYIYSRVEFEKDMSNYDDMVKEFYETFKAVDNKDQEQFSSFISECEEYGWD